MSALDSHDRSSSRETSTSFRPAVGGDSVSLIRLLNVPLRHRTPILRWTLAVATLGAGTAALRSREYRSSAAFIPQGNRLPGNLAGLAAQFGVAVPTGGEATRSPQFYAELLRSHDLLGGLVANKFDLGPARRGVTLVDLYGVPRFSLPFTRPRTAEERRERAIREIADRVHTEVSEKTGVVSFSVVTLAPALSRDVAAQLLEAVSRFNQDTRRSQAGAERRFAERRLAEARADLRRAEGRLLTFLVSNREFDAAPSLQLDRSRLNDDVSTQRQLVLTLTQSYEQARLEEVRDTPVVTVMDAPEIPVRPESRRVAVWAALGAALGLLAGIAIAYVREYMRLVRDDDSEGYAQFQALRGELARDLRAPLGRRREAGARPAGR